MSRMGMNIATARKNWKAQHEAGLDSLIGPRNAQGNRLGPHDHECVHDGRVCPTCRKFGRNDCMAHRDQ